MSKLEKFEAVVGEVFEGMSLNDALLKHGLTRQSFYEFKSENVKSADAYVRARQSRVELMVEQIIAIADNPDIDPNRARNMISVRQWSASKIIPHVYGDKIELNVNTKASIVDALAEAVARPLPIRYLGDVSDAEVIETNSISPDGATGSKPVGQSNVPVSAQVEIEDILK